LALLGEEGTELAPLGEEGKTWSFRIPSLSAPGAAGAGDAGAAAGAGAGGSAAGAPSVLLSAPTLSPCKVTPRGAASPPAAASPSVPPSPSPATPASRRSRPMRSASDTSAMYRARSAFSSPRSASFRSGMLLSACPPPRARARASS